jgi:hypothetical protein
MKRVLDFDVFSDLDFAADLDLVAAGPDLADTFIRHEDRSAPLHEGALSNMMIADPGAPPPAWLDSAPACADDATPKAPPMITLAARNVLARILLSTRQPVPPSTMDKLAQSP